MKSITLSLILLLVLSSSFGQKTSNISGKIHNPTGDKVFLFQHYYEENRLKSRPLDSCELRNGNFRLSAELDSLSILQFYDGNEFAFFYLKPGENINFTLNTQFFDESLVYMGDGSERNNMIKSIYIAEEITGMQKDMAYNGYHQNEEKDTAKLFGKLDLIDSTMIAYFNYQKTVFPELTTILDNKTEYRLKATERSKNNFRKAIKLENMNASEKGAPLMSLEAINLEGDDIKVSDFYGKLLVLDFWATWCGPCKAEFPALHELEKEYEGKVTFLGIASFCKEDDWREMATSEGFKHSIFVEREKFKDFSDKYVISTIPRYMILDKEGKILNLTAKRPSSGLADELNEYLK